MKVNSGIFQIIKKNIKFGSRDFEKLFKDEILKYINE